VAANIDEMPTGKLLLPQKLSTMRNFLPLLALLTCVACATTRDGISEKHLRHARALLATTPIVDTHIDFPWHLVEHKKWFKPGYTAYALKNPDGDFDLERAKKGGLYGPFMSIYIPASFQKTPGRSKQVADSLIDMVHAIAKDYPAQFALAPRAADIEANFKKGIVSLPMGMENGSPMEQLSDVAHFHRRGIRYVTLTHSRDNLICDSSYDTLHTHRGLSDYGRSVVREMNRLGIMVDVSHLSDEAIADVLTVATKPLIATHSGCRHFTPGFERNLPDSFIVAIARTGGVVQVPFSMYFLTSKHRTAFNKADAEREKQKLPEHGPAAKAFLAAYARRTGEPVYASVRDVADHIDHIKRLVGIEHVGLGSDFDGVGLALPPDLADVSHFPVLIGELLRRGYTDEEIRKICSGNVLRVWRANE
jgi:membrane dipeptidase